MTSECEQGTGAILHTRICGEKFAAIHAAESDELSICGEKKSDLIIFTVFFYFDHVSDCTTPFAINVKTDTTNDGAGNVVQRGVCLMYQMVGCSSP